MAKRFLVFLGTLIFVFDLGTLALHVPGRSAFVAAFTITLIALFPGSRGGGHTPHESPPINRCHPRPHRVMALEAVGTRRILLMPVNSKLAAVPASLASRKLAA